MYEVAIIGAGAAGIACAKEALKAGVPFIARITDSTNFTPEDESCVCSVHDLNGLIKFLSD